MTPNTATRSHSIPLTRWMVDSVTPSGRRPRAGSAARNQVSNAAGSGCRAATCSRRLEVVEVARALAPAGAVEQAHGPAQADARRVTTASTWPGGAPRRAAPTTTSRSSTSRSTLAPSLSGTESARPRRLRERPRRRRRSRSGNHWGSPRLGPAQDLDHVGGRDGPSGGGGDAQVGQRGPQPGALQHLGPQDRRHRDARLDQGDVGRQQQGVDPGEHGDVGRRDPGSASHPRRPRRRAVAPPSAAGARRPARPSAAGGAPARPGSSLATRRRL